MLSFDAKLILGKFRKLSGTEQRAVVDEIRHVRLGVAVLLRMDVEHELNQRAL